MSDTGVGEPNFPATSGKQETARESLPGAQLAARRQTLGWTIEQVANYLNLAPRQIKAIEDDNYAALPGVAVTRGFIRAYAKLLQIDVTPSLALIGNEPAPSKSAAAQRRIGLATPFNNAPISSRGKHGAVSKWIVGLGMCGVLALAAMAAQRMGWVPSALQFSPVKLDKESANPVPSNPVVPNSGNAQASGVGSTATLDASKNPAPGNVLTLKLREDSWVEIKQASQVSPSLRLLKAGTVESLEIKEPLSLKVSNAAGVDLILRGVPLDLKANAVNNTARLSIK